LTKIIQFFKLIHFSTQTAQKWVKTTHLHIHQTRGPSLLWIHGYNTTNNLIFAWFQSYLDYRLTQPCPLLKMIQILIQLTTPTLGDAETVSFGTTQYEPSVSNAYSQDWYQTDCLYYFIKFNQIHWMTRMHGTVGSVLVGTMVGETLVGKSTVANLQPTFITNFLNTTLPVRHYKIRPDK
jgi:hypothetical protein